jgi:hypothetical protein
MANAVLVERIAAKIGANAVLVHAVAAAAAPLPGNAVLVHAANANAVPPVGNAVLVQAVKATQAGAPPVANAGPDQSVEPWSTVSLTGAASTGTGLTYAWSQTSGPAVTLSGSGATRTFAAPPTMAGTTHTFSLTVTDGTGLVSTADTVTVTVLPCTEFVRVAGTWVPCRLMTRSGGAWV